MDRADEIAELLEEAAVLMLRHLTSRQDISLTGASALSRLRREGPLRLTVLAAGEGVTQPSMTQLIQKLERQGLVRREADPDDGRVALVAITDAGRELVAQRRSARADLLTALLGTLTPQEAETLGGAAQTALPLVRRLSEAASARTVN